MFGLHPARLMLAAVLASLQGCLVTQTMVDRLIDTDNDGYWEIGYRDGADCDDDDPLVNPAAGEICFDQLDNDCDGAVDEDGTGDQVIYADADADGYGDAAQPASSCFLLEGFAPRADDCDDKRADVHPEAPERCNGQDDDCDGRIDDDAPGTAWFRDRDGDGFGDPADTRVSCAGGPMWTNQPGDCDDADPAQYPGAPEAYYDAVDQDCAGDDDFDQDRDGYAHPAAGVGAPDCDDLNPAVHPGAPEQWYDGVDADCDPTTEYDADADGHAAAPFGDDCDDTTALIAPGNPETWYDGVDQDCDPTTEWDQDADGLGQPGTPHPNPIDCDDRAADTGGPTPWFRDADGDGYGIPGNVVYACAAPAGFTARAGDCDDFRQDVSPDAIEVCGDTDEDCDGAFDDGAGWLRFYDADRDGHGDPARGELRCPPFNAWVAFDDDCDDTRPDRSPDEPEQCDELDNDCNDVVDDGVGSWWYADADADTYGDPNAPPLQSCGPVPGRVLSANDCDDTDATFHPGAWDDCDGRDQDCDRTVDEDGWEQVFPDADGDGYGAAGQAGQRACLAPGLAPRTGDCDDADPAKNPGATELCDAVDNNCDGRTDEGLRLDLLPDADGDGYGQAGAARQSVCADAPRWAVGGGDCDDADPYIRPGVPEVCDHVDNDCDGVDDEGLRADRYLDRDDDGYGADLQPDACAAPGLVPRGGDCDDADPTIRPDTVDPCDGADNDCDLRVDEDSPYARFPDADGDGHGATFASLEPACPPFLGYAPNNDDCDDTNPSLSPSAPEYCDGFDTNCNGQADDDLRISGWLDEDGDGYGAVYFEEVCPEDFILVDDGGDCDDEDRFRAPRLAEICDGKDNDCDPVTPIDRTINDRPGISEICGEWMYSTFGGSIYLASRVTYTWTDAEDTCSSWGYHLIWPSGALEFASLYQAGLMNFNEVYWSGIVYDCPSVPNTGWSWFDRANGVCSSLSLANLGAFGLNPLGQQGTALAWKAVDGDPRALPAEPEDGVLDQFQYTVRDRAQAKLVVCERD